MEVSTLNTPKNLVVIVEIRCWLKIINEEIQEAVLSGKIPVPSKIINQMDEKSY
jgi:hypothetical protein